MKRTDIRAGRWFRIAPKLLLGAGLAAVLLFGSIQALEAADAKATAEALLSFDGLRPGLCVVVGDARGELLTELAIAGKYHVHGLTSDRRSLERIRQYVASRDLYGQVVVDHSPLKHLPYASNLINVLVVEDFADVQKNGLTLKEIMRVVAPESSALLGNAPADLKPAVMQAGYKDAVINQKGIWTQIVKPRPEGMDEWPQPHHDASSASISGDRLVRPPNAVQWIAGDSWRHESSPNPVLSTNGRIFASYPDQGIVARDAFNGLKLWQRKAAPAWIAAGDQLFARLKKGGPLVALDARTGKTIRTYSFGGSDRPWPPQARLAYHDGILLTGTVGVIEAYDAKSGAELWRKRIGSEKYVGLSTLALYQSINQKRIIAEGKVFLTLSETKEFLCLDLKTGKELWRVSSKGDRLVCYRKGILFSQFTERGKKDVFNAAYSARDGRFLWRHDYTRVWHGGHPHNIFLLDGLVWVLASIPAENVKYEKEPQAWHGLDPKDGAVVRRIDWEKTKHRCFGDRATEKYIIAGGMDFLDVETGRHHKFQGGRGSCSFGSVPANGLIYQLPNVCQCYAQVRGVVAFTGDTATADQRHETQDTGARQTGAGKPADETPSAEDWPMLRHDPARSGSTAAALPAELKPIWEQEIGGRLSSPVAACGKVFLSLIDDHRVIALDMKTGKTIWSYRANGRVDSPPTIYAGRAVFGCRDGWLYCVSSATGELIWSRPVAPRQRWLVCRGQVESAWPVHGSVLIDGDTAYFAAGRHSDVDGGVLLGAASPKSGEILWQKRLDVKSLKPTYRGPGNISNDILVSNGKTIFMRKVGFDVATGDESEERVSFWSGTGGNFLTDIIKPFAGGHEMSFRRWRLSKTGGLTLAFSGPSIFGVRAVGDTGNPWKFKSYRYEVFSCSREEDAKDKMLWQAALPKGVLPKAILHAGRKLYVAVVREGEGPGKGALLIHDAGDGRSLGAIPLSIRPKFDGLAAVNGNLILVGQDGQVICLAKD
jgi:outer membrane protein assembly factor BamB